MTPHGSISPGPGAAFQGLGGDRQVARPFSEE